MSLNDRSSSSSIFRVVQGLMRLTGKNGKNIADVTKDNRLKIDTGADDSFSRIKVAPPKLLFDSSFQYSLQDKVFIRKEEINAVITHDANRATARLFCSNDVGSRARIRTRNYFPYSPSFTNTMIGSFNFQGSVENVIKRLGLYDENNGFFVQVTGQGFEVGIRSKTTGTVVDNIVEQSNWNLDVMDGSGDPETNPSGISLNALNQQIIFLEFQWLGSGRVSFSFIIDGINYRVHEFNHANIITGLYSQTATLPIQAEIIGNGTSSYLEFTCCSLASNGADDQHGHLHTVSNGIVPVNAQTVGTEYPIISLRKQSGFTDIPIQILDLNAFSDTQDDFLIKVVHKPTLVNASWIPVSNSFAEYDVSATSFTGGDEVAQFYMKGNLQAAEKIDALAKFWDLTLGNDFDGNSEIITLVGVPLTNNANLYGIMHYKEYE